MMGRRYTMPIVFLAICLAEAVNLYRIWMAPEKIPAAIAPQSPPSPEISPAAVPPVLMPRREEFHDILDRPVFSPSRQHIDITADAVSRTVEIPLPSIIVQGTIIGPDTQIAMIKLSGQPSSQRFHTGEVIEGWKIEQIQQRHIVLTHGTIEKTVDARTLSAIKK